MMGFKSSWKPDLSDFCQDKNKLDLSVLSCIDQLETFQNQGAFPFWRTRMWSKTTELRSPRRGGLNLIPFQPRSGLFAARAQLTQQAQQIASTKWIIRSCTFMYCCVCAAHIDRAFRATHMFIKFTAFLSNICVICLSAPS